MDADNRIWWGKDGNNAPAVKRFLTEVKQGVVPQTLWPYDEVGHTQEGKKELVSIIDFADSESVFITRSLPDLSNEFSKSLPLLVILFLIRSLVLELRGTPR